MEASALDRGGFEDGALGRLESVDPRGEHSLDGRRQRLRLARALDRHELLEEERVSLSRLDDPRS